MTPTENTKQGGGRDETRASSRDRQLAKKFLGWTFPTRPPNDPQNGAWCVEGTPLHELPPDEQAFVVPPGTPIPRFTRDPAAALALSLRAGDLDRVTDTMIVTTDPEWGWNFSFTVSAPEGGSQGEERKRTFTWTDATRVLRDKVIQPLGSRLKGRGKRRLGFGVEAFSALVNALRRAQAWLGYRRERGFLLHEESSDAWTVELASSQEELHIKQRASTPGAAVALVLSKALQSDVERLQERRQGLEERLKAGVMFEEGVPALDLPTSSQPDDLRDWRSRQGLTQQAAADLVRVSRSSWQKWELDDNPRPGWLLLAIEGAMVRERRKEEE